MDKRPDRIPTEAGLFVVSTMATPADGGQGIRARIRAITEDARLERPAPAASNTETRSEPG